MPPTIPFPTADVPLIGQPCTTKSWFATALIVCNCGQDEPMMLVGLQAAVCPSCKQGYYVGSVLFNRNTGEAQLGIGVIPPQGLVAQ